MAFYIPFYTDVPYCSTNWIQECPGRRNHNHDQTFLANSIKGLVVRGACCFGLAFWLSICAEGAIALSVTPSGGAQFASWKLLQFPSSLIVKVASLSPFGMLGLLYFASACHDAIPAESPASLPLALGSSPAKL